MPETRDCPDCEQGKHQGCLEEVFDDSDPFDDLWWVSCPCSLRDHKKKSMTDDPALVSNDFDKWTPGDPCYSCGSTNTIWERDGKPIQPHCNDCGKDD